MKSVRIVFHWDLRFDFQLLSLFATNFNIAITGHNLNLDHSSEGSEEYGDQSGLMVSQKIYSKG